MPLLVMTMSVPSHEAATSGSSRSSFAEPRVTNSAATSSQPPEATVAAVVVVELLVALESVAIDSEVFESLALESLVSELVSSGPVVLGGSSALSAIDDVVAVSAEAAIVSLESRATLELDDPHAEATNIEQATTASRMDVRGFRLFIPPTMQTAAVDTL